MAQGKKKGNGCLVVIVIIVGIILGLFWGILDSDTDSETKESSETTTDEKTNSTTQEKKEKKPNTLKNGIEKYKSKEYPYITNADLETYAPNMEGVKIYTVVSVGELDEDDKQIKAHLSDSFMFSTFSVGKNFDTYKKLLKEDDRIAILGVVNKLNDYGFMGNSVALKDCYVFAYGDKADKYDLGKTSKSLSKYLTATEDVADSSDVSEDDYKALCEYLDYEDVLRNPDTYKKKYCQVSGTVDQIIEGFFNSFIIYVEDSNGDKWECTYYYKDGESHVLEGDSVTIYGKCDGTTTATNLMGQQVTLPAVDAEYIN